MQATSKEIYQKVAEDKDLSLELVKWVGDTFFKEWSLRLKNPSTIILKLKKLGRMYMRKNKIQKEVDRTLKYFDSEKAALSKEEYNQTRQRELEIYTKRLQEYELYVAKKKEIQALRWPFQPLLSPTDEPDRED